MVKDPIAGAARHRTAMVKAMQRVERVAARASGSSDWYDVLISGLTELETALHGHINEVESPSGLLDEIVDNAPRLQRAAEDTKTHHRTLSDMVAALQEMVASSRDSGTPPVSEVRAATVELLTELTRHRQKGADLIYEAYDVDIGGQVGDYRRRETAPVGGRRSDPSGLLAQSRDEPVPGARVGRIAADALPATRHHQAKSHW